MDIHPAIPVDRAPSASPSCEQDPAWAQFRARVALLDRLAEFGIQICEAMARQLKAPFGAPFAAPAPKLFQGDIALAYTRVSRAVRLALTLQMKLNNEMIASMRGGALPASAQATEAQTAEAKSAEPPTGSDRESCRESEAEPREGAETVERLGPEREAPDDIHALLDRPVDEVIDLICRDLGVSPEWVRQAKKAGPPPPEVERDDFGAPLNPWPGERPAPRPRKPPQRWPRPASSA